MFEELIEKSKEEYGFFKTKKSIYTQISWPGVSLPKWGWKIHISANYKNFKKIFLKVFNFFMEKKISFKFISFEKDFFKTFSKAYNRFSSGKFITVYCLDEKNFIETITSIDRLVSSYKGPFVLTDRFFKKNSCIYYRFGIFKKGLKYIYSDDHKLKFKDNRNFFSLPNFISDPFEDHFTKLVSKKANKNEIKLKGNKLIYSIKEALHFSNFGGVYVSVYKKNNKENLCVIKEFKQYMFDSPRLSCINQGIKEFKILKIFSKLDIVPKAIECFFYKKNFFFSRNYVNGNNLKNLKIYKTISFYGKLNKIALDKFTDFFLNLHKNFYYIVSSFHKRNITINDVKLENFVLDENEKIFLIDCDNCTEITKKKIKISDKKKFVFNPEVQPWILDHSVNSDFIKINLILIDLFCQTSNYTSLDKCNSLWRISKKLDLVCLKYNFFNFFIDSLKKYIDIKVEKREEIINFFDNFETKEIYSNNNILYNLVYQIEKIIFCFTSSKFGEYQLFFSENFFKKFILGKEIYLNKKDFNNLDWPIILIIIFCDFYHSQLKILKFANITVNNFSIKKLNDSVKTEKLFLYASCFLIKMKFNDNFDKCKQNLNIIFDYLIEHRLLKHNNNFLLKNLDFYSPHLMNGTVGLVFLLFIYTYKSKDFKYFNDIKNLFKIFEISYLSKVSFLNGITGYLLIYLVIIEIINKEQLSKFINDEFFKFNLNLVKEKILNIFLSIKMNKKDFSFIDLYYEINKNHKEYYYVLFSLYLIKKILEGLKIKNRFNYEK